MRLIRPASWTSSSPFRKGAVEGGGRDEGRGGRKDRAEEGEGGARPGQGADERQRDQAAGDGRQAEPGPAVGRGDPRARAVCNTKCSVVMKVTTAGELWSPTSGCDIVPASSGSGSAGASMIRHPWHHWPGRAASPGRHDPPPASAKLIPPGRHTSPRWASRVRRAVSRKPLCASSRPDYYLPAGRARGTSQTGPAALAPTAAGLVVPGRPSILGLCTMMPLVQIDGRSHRGQAAAAALVRGGGQGHQRQ